MAIERSPYEGTFDSLNGKTALGRVVSVDIPNRRCRVKTIGSQGPKLVAGKGTGTGTDDLDIFDVQWITTAASDGGAEDNCVPAIGQIGVILFINSEPYIVGYFRTLQPSPEDVPSDETTDPVEDLITQGDRVLSTIGGNSIILRAGGSIEIRGTDLCRTFWLPSNLLTSVCSNYELGTDGGFMQWNMDKDSQDVLLEYFVLDNQKPTNAVDIQFGKSDNGNTIELTMGEVDENSFDFTQKKLHLSVDPDGTLIVEIGDVSSGNPKAKLMIDANTGDTTYETQGKMTQTIKGDLEIDVTGDTTLKVQGKLEATVQGDVKLDTQGKLDATVQGDVSVDTQGSATVSSVGDATVKSQGSGIVSAASGIKLDGVGGGGEAAEFFILVNPLALSDFTGAPIETPSASVAASS